MAELEIRELRYFRAVADEGSLSRAATRLGMAQPPLSRAIGRLERRLGVRLFERDNRGVTLTPAGATLLTESDQVLDAVTAAAQRTRRAALDPPTLVITGKPGVASALLARIADAYRTRPGGARVEILVSGYGEQAGLVRSGRVDLALVGSPHNNPGLDTEPLVSEPRLAALPAGHDLARRQVLRLADLAGQPMPQWVGAGPDEQDYWTGQTGATTGPSIKDSSQLIEVVALGQAVALIPSSLAEGNRRANVVYRPVEDASPYVLAIAWATGSRNPLVASFVRTAVELTDAPLTAAG